MRNATGKEYIIDPRIIPGMPMILKFKNLEIKPLVPNKFISPRPCDIEGINIGIVNNTFKIARWAILVLLMVYANNQAMRIDITVETVVTTSELVKASWNDTDDSNELKSDHSIFESIDNNGKNTVINRNNNIKILNL